jgi:large-conductance mechanosensitive channel
MQQAIPFLAIGVFVFLAWTAIRSARRRLREQERLMQQMGFAKSDPRDPLIQNELLALISRRKKGATLSNIYRYANSGYDLFRYDVRHGKESNTGAMALLLHDLHLPAMSIAPRIELPGIFGKLVNKLVESVITRAGAEEVELSGCPQFGKKYRVFVQGGQAAVRALPPIVWDRLAALSGQMLLDVDGRVVTYQEMITTTRKRGTRGDLRQELQNTLHLADQVYSCFRDARTAVTA